MAKVKVKGLNNIPSKIRKAITKQLRTKEVRQGFAKIVVDDIRDSDYGRPSDSYYQWREDNDGLNKTHSKYNRDKINITFTGELLDDLEKNAVVETTQGKVQYVLEHSDKLHKSYKTQSGKTKRVTFSKISEGVQRYYSYLTVSKNAINKGSKYIVEEAKKALKNIK